MLRHDTVDPEPESTTLTTPRASRPSRHLAYETDLGKMLEGDSLEIMRDLEDESVDLIVTSPPFALVAQQEYGNESQDDYRQWFLPFAEQMKRVVKDTGSIVIDLGGAWTPQMPTKSLYQFRLLLDLVDKLDLHLAQDFYWYNTSKLPSPVQWVNIERTRVKDAVNNIWWMSKTPHPKANNLNVLAEYKPSMRKLLRTGKYNDGKRAGRWVIGKDSFNSDSGGSIPPNVIEVDALDIGDDDATRIASRIGAFPLSAMNEPTNVLAFGNSGSKDPYHAFCQQNELRRHPARFPRRVPEFFIEFLTDPGDVVLDPFGGSNVTGMMAEDLKRQWISIELDHEYIAGSVVRFAPDALTIHDPALRDLLEAMSEG